MAGMYKDLTPIPSPKARGNTDDQSDDHPEGFAAIFVIALLLGRRDRDEVCLCLKHFFP
jgi:hypothetical protein